MKTNFQMLRELLEVYHPEEIGFLNKHEIMLIKQTLCIEEMDILQLRNLRDFTVLQLRNLRDFTVLHLGRSEKREDWDRMSAIIHIIDSRIFDLGGEV